MFLCSFSSCSKAHRFFLFVSTCSDCSSRIPQLRQECSHPSENTMRLNPVCQFSFDLTSLESQAGGVYHRLNNNFFRHLHIISTLVVFLTWNCSWSSVHRGQQFAGHPARPRLVDSHLPGSHHWWTGVGRRGPDATRRKGSDHNSATDSPGKGL